MRTLCYNGFINHFGRNHHGLPHPRTGRIVRLPFYRHFRTIQWKTPAQPSQKALYLGNAGRAHRSWRIHPLTSGQAATRAGQTAKSLSHRFMRWALFPKARWQKCASLMSCRRMSPTQASRRYCMSISKPCLRGTNLHRIYAKTGRSDHTSPRLGLLTYALQLPCLQSWSWQLCSPQS